MLTSGTQYPTLQVHSTERESIMDSMYSKSMRRFACLCTTTHQTHTLPWNRPASRPAVSERRHACVLSHRLSDA